MSFTKICLLISLALSSLLSVVSLDQTPSSLGAGQCTAKTGVELTSQLRGIWQAWMIATAVRFDIAEHLRNQSLTIEELAQETDTNVDALQRLMRALSYFKIFNQNGDGKWTLTPLSLHLTSDEDCDLRDIATLMVRDDSYIWPQFHKYIETGKPFFGQGIGYWEFLSKHPTRSPALRRAAGDIIRVFNKDIPKMYDFTKYKHIVDISGNDGTLLTMLLKAAPEAKGTVFDMEYLRKDAEEYFKKHGVDDRADFFAGDFVKTMPEGGDLYVMRQAFHDWQDEDALKILKNVAEQMKKKPAKMLIMNLFLPEDNHPIAEHVWEVYTNMMVGGLDRTRKEYEALFKKAGLRLEKVIPARGTNPSIMEIVLDS